MARLSSSVVKCRPSRGILNESTVARCNRNSGGNGGCGKDFSCHEVTGEDPSVIGLDGAGT